MSFPSFTTQTLGESGGTTLQSVIRVVNQLTSNLSAIFTQLLKKTQLDSILLQNIVLQEGLNTIPHTLGRNLSGYEVVLRSGTVSYYDAQSDNRIAVAPATYLYLYASADVTVSLIVF